MNCLVCRGACCETFEIPVVALDLHDDGSYWLSLHGTVKERDPPDFPVLSFNCRCTKLTKEGRCDVYDRRPIACSEYKAGGPDCLRVVKERRTPEEYRQIRDEGDPETLWP